MPTATPPPDAYSVDCPGRQTLDRIDDRWTILVLGAPADGPRRFTELARRIEESVRRCSARRCAGSSATAW